MKYELWSVGIFPGRPGEFAVKVVDLESPSSVTALEEAFEIITQQTNAQKKAIKALAPEVYSLTHSSDDELSVRDVKQNLRVRMLSSGVRTILQSGRSYWYEIREV